jgi:virulence factor Mce-like protein
MQKQAPSVARILIAVGFALSCFGLLLFLWIAFGGPTPLSPKSYRFTADFPEAAQLSKESDVRIGGVSVGKVKALSLPKDGNATEAEIELKPEFSPLPEDSRAILRQKTLLGETYVELTRGSDSGPKVPEGGHLNNTQVQDQTQIDEIFNALDPVTRQNFRLWMQNAATSIDGRGLDLNDALGNLGPFAADAAQVLATIRRQDKAFGDLINHTGGVFQALSSRNQELAGAITGANATFGAIAARDKALVTTLRIFPTFNKETRLTLNRLGEFSANANPLIRNLKLAAVDLSPTLTSLRKLSPNLKRFFQNLDPLITAGQTGLPALRDTLDTLRPTLAALEPFLANLNPVLSYLLDYKYFVTDFLQGPPQAISGIMQPLVGQGHVRHVFRQLGYTSAEVLSIYPQRLSTNRGNGYLQSDFAAQPRTATYAIFPNFDCKPSGGDRNVQPPDDANANCFVQPPFPAAFGGGQAPQLFQDP